MSKTNYFHRTFTNTIFVLTLIVGLLLFGGVNETRGEQFFSHWDIEAGIEDGYTIVPDGMVYPTPYFEPSVSNLGGGLLSLTIEAPYPYVFDAVRVNLVLPKGSNIASAKETSYVAASSMSLDSYSFSTKEVEVNSWVEFQQYTADFIVGGLEELLSKIAPVVLACGGTYFWPPLAPVCVWVAAHHNEIGDIIHGAIATYQEIDTHKNIAEYLSTNNFTLGAVKTYDIASNIVQHNLAIQLTSETYQIQIVVDAHLRLPNFYIDAHGSETSQYYTEAEVLRIINCTASPAVLSIRSLPDSGVYISLNQEDLSGQQDGTTPFTRNYYEGREVVLTAPSTDKSDWDFKEWRVDGDFYSATRSIQITINQDSEAVAVYESAGSPILVNGSSSPETLKLNASQGSSTEVGILVRNQSSVPIEVNVSKNGEMASWISLPTTSFHIDPNSTVVYQPLDIDVPASADYRQYSGDIRFNDIVLPILITVAEISSGENYFDLQPATASINGEVDSMNVWFNTWDGWYVLDDCDQKNWTYGIGLTSDFGNEFDRLQSWEFSVTVKKLEAEQYSERLVFKVNNSTLRTISPSSVQQGDEVQVKLDMYEEASPGFNEIKIYPYSFVNCQGKEFWQLTDFRFGWWNSITFSKSAWGSSKTFSAGEYDAIRNGFEKVQVQAIVQSVDRSGDVHLFNNGEKVYTRSIDNSDVGDEVTWSLSRSEFERDNRFSLRGDTDDETKVELGQLKLYVKYYAGSPLLAISKSISSQNINLGEQATVTIRLTNNGSNIAEDISLIDAALPDGLVLAEGGLTASFDEILPGQERSDIYKITATTVGDFVVGSATLQYQDPGNNDYESSSNVTGIEVKGGQLLASPTIFVINYAEGIKFDTTAQIISELSGNAIADADVEAVIEKGNGEDWNNYGSFPLGYDPESGRYAGRSDLITDYGIFRVQIRAERPYYDTGISDYATFVIDRYRISGQIALHGGAASVTDVVLTLCGDATCAVHANQSSNYTFVDLMGGTYTVIPSCPGYHFFPHSVSYSPLNSDQTGQDFIGLHETYDAEPDNLPDWWEQQIINADPDDGITNVEDVLPGGDFDGDGFTNLQEYLAGTHPTDENSKPIIKGDINADGSVDLADAILTLRMLVGIGTGDTYPNRDVNGDGKIGLSEAIFIMRRVGEL